MHEAMKRAGIKMGRPHRSGFYNYMHLYGDHSIPDGVKEWVSGKKRFTFAFIRHPVTWYESFWAYRTNHGKKGNMPLDDLYHPDFEVFMDMVLRNFPDGFVTALYSFYIGRTFGKLDFVGKQENSADDLVKALKLSGEKFDEKALRSMPKVNVSPKGIRPKMSSKMKRRVNEAENWIISHYY